MKSEHKLLRALAESDDDVKNDRVAPMKDSFTYLRTSLLERESKPTEGSDPSRKPS